MLNEDCIGSGSTVVFEYMCSVLPCNGGAEGASSAYIFIIVTDCSDNSMLVLPGFWPQFPVDESHVDDDVVSASEGFFCRRRRQMTRTVIQTMTSNSSRHATGRNKPKCSVGLTALPRGGSSVLITTQRVRSMWSWLATAVTHTLYVVLCDRFPMTYL